MSTATQPVRYPNSGDRAFMTKRAWWLVVLNLVIPGSAQVLAGNRRLGRLGLAATLALWALAVLAIALFLFWRTPLFVVGTNVIALWAVQILLVGYAALWVVLTLDAMRLANLVRARRSSRAPIALLSIAGLLLTAGTAGYGAMVTGSTRELLAGVFAGGSLADPVDGRYNIMLLGGDAGPDRIGIRPDSISVASIDADTGAVTMIGIPRNLQDAPFSEGSPMWDEFPDGYSCGDECLISYLYTYGEEHPELYPDAAARSTNAGIEAMRDAVEGVLGIQVQYYVLIEMQGFIQLIDALGGIDIDVAERVGIGSNTTPDGRPAEAGGWIEPGAHHMDGQTALWYARSRYGTTDYARMERQRQVQEAILQQFQPENVLLRFQEVARASADLATTDLPQDGVGYLADLGLRAKGQPITRLQLVPDRFQPDDPDFDLIHAAVAEALTPAG